MKPNFTPGPWKVKHGGWMCEGRSLYGVFPIYQRDGEMFQEDAFLCSAAPEMYEALEAVEEYFAACRRPNIYQNPGEIQSITAETARMLVEKALKKARGGK